MRALLPLALLVFMAQLGCGLFVGNDRLECDADSDCLEGNRCIANTCAPDKPADGGNAAPDASVPDSGQLPDTGPSGDAGLNPDAGPSLDAALPGSDAAIADSGTSSDAGAVSDAGASPDAGAPPDAGVIMDAGAFPDAGVSMDAGPPPDSGPPCIDLDGDGHGDNCALGIDCDDNDAHRHKDLTESCDGIDNDCNNIADDDGTCPCTRLDDGDALHPYLFCEFPANYDDAIRVCGQFDNYRLVKIDDTPEETWLINAITVTLTPIWGAQSPFIGLDDRVNENAFIWSDGESLGTLMNWVALQPDDSDAMEDCVHYQSSLGGWNDRRCNTPEGSFICEVDLTNRASPGSCSDADGDFRGPRCAAGPDCDDNDGSVWRWHLGYEDLDEDLKSSNAKAFHCGGATLPSTLLTAQTVIRDPNEVPGTPPQPADCFQRQYEGTRYMFCKENLNHDNAGLACGQHFTDGRLIILDEPLIMSWFERQIDGLYEATDNAVEWRIGLRTAMGSSSQFWSDGSPLVAAYAGWNYEQPNGGTDTCVIANKENLNGDRGWNDWACGDASFYYACEEP
jgi:hypothetical protein